MSTRWTRLEKWLAVFISAVVIIGGLLVVKMMPTGEQIQTAMYDWADRARIASDASAERIRIEREAKMTPEEREERYLQSLQIQAYYEKKAVEDAQRDRVYNRCIGLAEGTIAECEAKAKR
jgi:hypothetical protein